MYLSAKHNLFFTFLHFHNSMSVGKPFFLVKLSCPETNLTTSVVVQVGFYFAFHLLIGKILLMM